MADEQQLDRLKNGVAAWNKWRSENKFVEIDLSEALLHLADLRGANLREANLSRADLSRADLRKADLRKAKLSTADLSRANLGWADLGEAELAMADLTGASLFKANLFRARLGLANLRGANFSEANINGANLCGANLNGAILLKANLNGADLSAADLDGANLTGANFETRRSRLRLDWSKVRKFGELRFLTRASYIAIVMVPILSGLWPAVRATVNTYNETLLQSTLDTHEKVVELADKMSTASKDLNPRLGQLLTDRTSQLDIKITELGQSLNQAALEEKNLPYGFAAAFFAALAVIFGHLIYELFADQHVKKSSRESVSNEALKQFDPASPDVRRRLGHALYNIKQIADLRPRNRHPNLVRLPFKVVWIPSDVDYLVRESDDTHHNTDDRTGADSSKPAGESPGFGKYSYRIPPADSIQDQQLLVIEQGAIAEYDAAANRNLGWAALAMVLYLTGMALIGSVLWQQSINVASEAGWL